MSEEQKTEEVLIKSSRFGDFTVPKSALIEFPTGVIGFPKEHEYVVVEHKPPFSWLHSCSNPSLAFVVVDGFEFGASYDLKVPYGDPNIDLKEGDDFALLVVVTVRPDPSMTTANLKAPIFVNLRNRKGVQLVLDDARFSTRFPLWGEKDETKAGTADPAKGAAVTPGKGADKPAEDAKKKP